MPERAQEGEEERGEEDGQVARCQDRFIGPGLCYKTPRGGRPLWARR